MPSQLAVVPQQRRFLSKGARACKFIETYCVFTKGKWLGRPFVLLPWQRAWIMQLFEVDPETRLRRYRWALLGVPKKNGKTELIAALGLYFLIADGEATPEVVCAAASKEQAGLIFGAAKTMCEKSDRLKGVTKLWTSSIECPENGGKMYIVAAADGTNDGKNISALLIDELHEWVKPKSVSVWTTLTGGAQWREEPITIQITTAGVYDPDSLWWREYTRGKAIASGEVIDPSYFFTWFEAPEHSDYRDPEAWRIANPSFDALAMEPVLRDLLNKRTPGQFKRYHCNLATDDAESWLYEGAWDACRVPSFSLSRDVPTWAAVDASANSDSCAVSWGQWRDFTGTAPDGGEYTRRRLAVKARIWRPPLGQDGLDDPEWKMPHAEVENFLRELASYFRIEEIAYDPYNFRRSADLLADEGLPMLEFPQHPSRTAPATKLLRDMIHDGEIAHDGNAALRDQVVSAVIVPVSDVNESFRLSKGRSKKRIDGAASLMMLAAVVTGNAEVQATPGIIVL